jgi:hypothetical protein
MRLHGSVRNLLKDQKIADLLITQSAPSQRTGKSGNSVLRKGLGENEEGKPSSMYCLHSRRSSRLNKKPYKLEASEEYEEEEEEDTQDEAPNLLMHLYKSPRDQSPKCKPAPIVCPSPSKPAKFFSSSSFPSETAHDVFSLLTPGK